MHAILLAIAAGLCWGIGELFTKSVLHSQQVGPITAITIRSTVAIPVLWLTWLAMRGGMFGLKAEPALFKADGSVLLKLTLGSGLIAGAAAMIFFYTALSLGEISRVKPIAFALAPATAVVLAALVLGEPFTVRKAIAVMMILGGVVLLTGK